MSQPGRAAGLDETVLDEGRTRRFGPPVPPRGTGLDETLLDPGRHRPDKAAGPDTAGWPGSGLPTALAQRYALVRRLDVPASQGELFLVRSRADGTEAVVKRRITAYRPDPGLAAYLGDAHDHVVRYHELTADHEVMEYLPGGSLLQRRAALPAGFGFGNLHTLVRQIAAALIGLHRQGYVHRDVKPANIVLRSAEPLDAVLVDFGVAGPTGSTEWPGWPNPAYQPPEWCLLNEAGEQTDWWGLGMTLLELASGEHPFEGLAAEDIRRHFGSSRPVDVSGVPDDPPSAGSRHRDRLRNLCQGLLCPDPAERWGADEVSRWLVGQDPPLPSRASWVDPGAGRPEVGAVGAETPFVFRGVRHHYRDELAQAMTTAWNRAAEVLFASGGRLGELRSWLDQFPDVEGFEARRVVTEIGADPAGSVHVRLFRVLRALDPTRPPVYRNHIISRRGLLMIAHRAMENEGDDASVIDDLWRHRLLPAFDTAAAAESAGPPPAPPSAGDMSSARSADGQALSELDQSWRAERRRWPTLLGRVDDAQAREYAREAVGESSVRAVCLRAALSIPEDAETVRRTLSDVDASLRPPVRWFGDLVSRPETLWLALVLVGHARSQARTAADRIRAREEEAEALRLSAAFREWSRRQNRPAALGWAVAGVCVLAVVWVALITGSDAVNMVGDPVIGLAWVGAAVGLVVCLLVESLLAVEIGGRFHARYSIPGAGAIALRPLGRWMRRDWRSAAVAILVVLAVVLFVAFCYPQFVAAGTTVAHFIWAARRWARWRATITAEEELVAEAERRRPSDTGDAPIGTS